jgi:hypothetical protein
MMVSMKKLYWILLIAAVFFDLERTEAADPPEKLAATATDKARIASLIADLDADKFATRENASAQLLQIGEPALPALKAAMEHPASPEVRSRAEYLLHEIGIWGGPHHEIRLIDMLEQVKLAARADNPSTACDNGKLESLSKQCVRVLGGAAKRASLDLPVDFKQVQYKEYNPQGSDRTISERNALVILKHGQIIQVDHCIVLADEAVNVVSASSSIIIARVAVDISSCHNCLVVAGVELNVSSDNESILLSGGDAECDIIRGSICSAEGQLSIGIPQDSTVINSKAELDRLRQIQGRNPNRSIRIPELSLTNPSVKNSLAGRIHVTDVIPLRDGIALIRLNDGSGEYVARYGQPINDPKGKSLPELKGWTLCHTARRSAVFTDGNDFAIVPADP